MSGECQGAGRGALGAGRKCMPSGTSRGMGYQGALGGSWGCRGNQGVSGAIRGCRGCQGCIGAGRECRGSGGIGGLARGVGGIGSGRWTGNPTTLGPSPGSQHSDWLPLGSDLPDQGQASDRNELSGLLYTFGTIFSDSLYICIYNA